MSRFRCRGRRGIEHLSQDPKMNRFERRPVDTGEAKVEFLDGDFRILRPGAYVRCAMTGEPIPLDELRYWSVDRQEAYDTPTSTTRARAQHKEIQANPNKNPWIHLELFGRIEAFQGVMPETNKKDR